MITVVRWKADAIINQDAYHIRLLKGEGVVGDRATWRQWQLSPQGEWVEYRDYDVLGNAFIVVPGYIYDSGPDSLRTFVGDALAATRQRTAEAIADIKAAIKAAI